MSWADCPRHGETGNIWVHGLGGDGEPPEKSDTPVGASCVGQTPSLPSNSTGGVPRTIGIAVAPPTTPVRQARAHMRIAWFHVPKCGSSLANIVLHLANASLPPSTSIADARSCIGSQHHNCLHKIPGVHSLTATLSISGFATTRFGTGRRSSTTVILESDYKAFRGNFVGMFRSPEPVSLRSHPTEGTASWASQDTPSCCSDEYTRRIQETVVKMLAGQSHGLACDVLEPLAMQQSVPTFRWRCVDCTGLRCRAHRGGTLSICLPPHPRWPL